MFLTTKIWDAINDPILGLLSDRTQTAWGKFRPYLIWMSLPFAITGMLTFYTPNLPENGKLIYAYITYTLVFMAYTAINVPYGALMGVISPSSLERTSISTYRFVLAFAGGLFVQFFTNPLIRFFGGTKEVLTETGTVTIVADPQSGFFWTAVCYAITAVALFTITFFTTRERVEPEQKSNTKFLVDVKDLSRNRPWIVLLLVGLFEILAGWTRGSATGFYFTYYTKFEVNYLLDLGPLGKYMDVSDFGFFFGVGTICGIIGMFLTGPLVRLFGNKLLLILILLCDAICISLFLFIDKDQWWAMYGLRCFGSFISGPMPILVFAMYADTADYSEWVNHRRATGLVYATAAFSKKLGSALGSAIPAWLLGYSGFIAPINDIPQPQPEKAIECIIYMMSIIPAGFLVLGCIAMLFYNLDSSLLIDIESDLATRKLESSRCERNDDSKPSHE